MPNFSYCRQMSKSTDNIKNIQADINIRCHPHVNKAFYHKKADVSQRFSQILLITRLILSTEGTQC